MNRLTENRASEIDDGKKKKKSGLNGDEKL